MKTSGKQNYYLAWLGHLTIDPFVVMILLGALGHLRHWAILYSFSYIQVWLATVAAQYFWPFDIQAKIVPSKEKVEL